MEVSEEQLAVRTGVIPPFIVNWQHSTAIPNIEELGPQYLPIISHILAKMCRMRLKIGKCWYLK